MSCTKKALTFLTLLMASVWVGGYVLNLIPNEHWAMKPAAVTFFMGGTIGFFGMLWAFLNESEEP